jgi:hypothetical protein
LSEFLPQPDLLGDHLDVDAGRALSRSAGANWINFNSASVCSSPNISMQDAPGRRGRPPAIVSPPPHAPSITNQDALDDTDVSQDGSAADPFSPPPTPPRPGGGGGGGFHVPCAREEEGPANPSKILHEIAPTEAQAEREARAWRSSGIGWSSSVNRTPSPKRGVNTREAEVSRTTAAPRGVGGGRGGGGGGGIPGLQASDSLTSGASSVSSRGAEEDLSSSSQTGDELYEGSLGHFFSQVLSLVTFV